MPPAGVLVSSVERAPHLQRIKVSASRRLSPMTVALHVSSVAQSSSERAICGATFSRSTRKRTWLVRYLAVLEGLEGRTSYGHTCATVTHPAPIEGRLLHTARHTFVTFVTQSYSH